MSAALGDAGPAAGVGRRARTAAALGAAFVKVGCRGVETIAGAGRLAVAARRGAGEGVRIVLVAYADWRRAASLAPERVAAAAAERGAAGVLLDTAFKEAGLFELLPRDAVGYWVAQAHAAGLFTCLAGSLRGGDFATARALGADFVGVRGAACVGGRTGRVSRARVAALSALAGAVSPPLEAALV